MDSINQDFSTTFAAGTMSGVLTIEGDGMEDRREMLANIFAYVAKDTYDSLIPHLTEMVKDVEPPDGQTLVEEQIKVELFDITVTLDLKLDLNVEIQSPTREALRFFVIEVIGPEVVLDIVKRISARLKNETIREYQKQHADEAPPGFGAGGIGDLLRGLGGGGATVVVGGRGPGGSDDPVLL